MDDGHINGCDSFPDGIGSLTWKVCCDAHDVAYTAGGDLWYRLSADWALATCVNGVLFPIGYVMLLGVALFGWLFFRFTGLAGRNITEIITERRPSVAVSLRIKKYIGGQEGKVLRAYKDPVHVITIGYGFTWGSKVFREWYAANRGPGKLKMGDTMTEAEALHVLGLLIEREYAPPVDAKFKGRKVNVREGGYDTTFNCGNGALDWKWAAAIARGDVAGGAALLRTTATTAKGQRLPGLVRRRKETATIIEKDVWPSWVGDASETATVAPETHTYTEDIAQAQKWLEELGYSPGPADGVVGGRTINATRRFQTEHGQLTVDGKIGNATLNALQRAVDLKKKAGTTVVVGAGTSGAGGLENGTDVGSSVPTPPETGGDLGWIGDVLLWGGLVVGVGVLVYLAWRYKDEINAVLRRLA